MYNSGNQNPTQPNIPPEQPTQPGHAVPPQVPPRAPAVQSPQRPPVAPVYQSPYQPSPPRPKRKRGRFQLACLGCVISLAAVVALFFCVGFTALAIIWNQLDTELGDQLRKKEAEQDKAFQTARVYDRFGNQLHELFTEGRRTKIKLADMPKYLLDATVAVEDKSFYENPGVDWVGISRAGLQYFQASAGGGGGSTITQQLVRNIAFDYGYRTERSARRKFEEIMMALILTREKPKDEILEMYLNQIYYGNIAYGIEAAAQTYFGKPAKNLTLAEAALLAGLPQAPAELDPLNPDPQVQEAVMARRKVVLDLMVDTGKISRQQANEAMAQPLSYANPNVTLKSPHFTLYAQEELKALLEGLRLPPEYLISSGLKVYTSLDPNIQALAENVARDQINKIKGPNNANNATVVILKPVTGEILAMVGSVDYYNQSIQGRVNVAISKKQPGSAIKPLTYAAAMERGFSPATVLWDVDTRIRLAGNQIYQPKNYDNGYRGPVRLRAALANSYNIPAVQTLREIGVDALLAYANRVRITSFGTDPSKWGLAITLGGAELTPLELANAYAVFANGGNLVSSTSILCLVDGSGKVVYQYENGCSGRATPEANTINAAATPKAVLDPRIAFLISDILGDNAARAPMMGANSPLRTDGIVSSVKTGTTNDYRDNWTVGYTKNIVIAVWVGNTDSKPMRNTTGLTGAAPIWNEILRSIYANQGMMDALKRGGNLVPEQLTPPPGLSRRRICDVIIRDPADKCVQNRTEWFFDSPPLAPDASGRMVQRPVTAPTRAPQNGPQVLEFEPGVVQTLVYPLDPAIAATIKIAAVPGERPAPAPLYCLVPNEVKDQVPGAVNQVFLKPPPFAEQANSARIWSQANKIAILPPIPCTAEMLVPPQPPQTADGVTTQITSPRQGDAVTGMVQVVGTASWPPDRGQYYKMEIQGPQFPGWTTFGSTHNNMVINGPLDQFGAEGLQPGVYKVRIVVVAKDNSVMAISSELAVNVSGR